jgi:hypothetical protein
MTIKYECDVCHKDAKVEDSRCIRLTDSIEKEFATKGDKMKFDLHLCSQQCKDRLVICIKNFLAPPEEESNES